MVRFGRSSKPALWFYGLAVLVLVLKVLPGWKKYSSYEWSLKIPSANAKDVWDFVADLNHFRITDPGVASMAITSDQWTHPEWRYGALLKEIRSETGEWNTEADYLIIHSARGYTVETTFSTCRKYRCVQGHSEVTFTPSSERGHSEATLLRETLTLSGNWFIWPFLATEELAKVHLNRLNNIRDHFIAKSFIGRKPIV